MAGMTSEDTFYYKNSQPEFTCGCLQAQPGKHIYPYDVLGHRGDIKPRVAKGEVFQ